MGLEPTTYPWQGNVFPKDNLARCFSSNYFSWLRWLGSNQRNDRAKIWCLTSWLHPNFWYSQPDSNRYYARERGMTWPLVDGSICWFGYSRPITLSGLSSSGGLCISSIIILLLVLWVLVGAPCCLDIRQTKLSPFNLNIFFYFKKNHVFGVPSVSG